MAPRWTARIQKTFYIYGAELLVINRKVRIDDIDEQCEEVEHWGALRLREVPVVLYQFDGSRPPFLRQLWWNRRWLEYPDGLCFLGI